MPACARCPGRPSDWVVDVRGRLANEPLSEQQIFVYGSLRKGLRHEMHRVLDRAARFVANATVRGALFDLGAYPGLVVAESATGVVTGELYVLDAGNAEQTLALLDDYEGCASSDLEPHEFRRALMQVTLADGSTRSAWAYLLNRPYAGLTRIPSGDYLAWQGRAARVVNDPARKPVS
jgi:gamma-glutamylcyclotransferase (GGCT)/AIG2-like uncharacterized protein YtfP